MRSKRLDVLEQRASDWLRVEEEKAYSEFQAWLKANITPDERAALDRELLNAPLDDETLARVGETRESQAEVLKIVGPVLPGDAELIGGLLARIPAEMRARWEVLKAAGVEAGYP